MGKAKFDILQRTIPVDLLLCIAYKSTGQQGAPAAPPRGGVIFK
jgi:hypothetical protein